MSCERYRKAVLEAATGATSSELETHLSRCEACRVALAAENALLHRIDTELEDSMGAEPSPAFLPGVRRRVGELQAQREAGRRWWLVPALATLAGVLVVGHFVGEDARDPVAGPAPPLAARAVSSTARVESAPNPPGEVPPPAARHEPALGRSTRVVRPAERIAPETGPAPEIPSPTIRPEPIVAPARPRVFVPAEDERAVRRLARRLRGHAARAAVLAPEAEGPVDFTPEPVADRPALVSLDDRALRGEEPGLEEPPSFDRMVEKAGRET